MHIMQIRWVTAILLQLVTLPLFAQTPTPAQSETDAKLIESQRERINALQQQQTTLRNRLRQEERRSRQAEERLVVAEKTIESRNDSIGWYIQAVNDLNGRLSQMQIAQREAEAARARVEVVRDTALAKVARLTYERNLLTVSDLIRIYRVTPAKTLAALLQNLNQTESEFQYSVDSTANELKIIRHFDDQTEAWWVFDKTLDTILELTLQFKRHRFDQNRTLVFASSRLLQKVRYSNKPFEEQNDTEKIALYRDKTLKLLEGNLRKSSDK
jgi:chromosome segregation ATPase